MLCEKGKTSFVVLKFCSFSLSLSFPWANQFLPFCSLINLSLFGYIFFLFYVNKLLCRFSFVSLHFNWIVSVKLGIFFWNMSLFLITRKKNYHHICASLFASFCFYSFIFCLGDRSWLLWKVSRGKRTTSLYIICHKTITVLFLLLLIVTISNAALLLCDLLTLS